MTDKDIITKYIPKDFSPLPKNNLILFNVSSDKIVDVCKNLYLTHKLPIKIIKATDERSLNGGFKILYVFGIPHEKFFLTPYITVKETTDFPSLVPFIHEASLYELEIYNFFGLTPIGHPQIQHFILHENWPDAVYPLRKDFKWDTRPKFIDKHAGTFQEVKGEGIYEIPVGPVHAGIIEPGHFRFSVLGEEIVLLQPNLGYTHKGIEKLFEVVPMPKKIQLAERVSGDTSFTHSLAFCQAVEKLSDTTVPERAKHLRLIYSELERIANHCNDIGFILNDTAFAFGGSSGSRLKEKIMQLCANLTGHRFLRGVNTVGGVACDLSTEQMQHVVQTVQEVAKDLEEIVNIAENNESVVNRLKNTGILDKTIAKDHGVVGMAARACGIPVDSRSDYPYDAYEKLRPAIAHATAGDVYARFHIRIAEVIASSSLIIKAVKTLPHGTTSVPFKSLKKNSYAISITEGWRGDIVYLVSTDASGEINRVGIRDASFLNWPAVPFAVTGNIVPDFPLINKSFNLSYSGFDR